MGLANYEKIVEQAVRGQLRVKQPHFSAAAKPFAHAHVALRAHCNLYSLDGGVSANYNTETPRTATIIQSMQESMFCAEPTACSIICDLSEDGGKCETDDLSNVGRQWLHD